MKSVTVYRVDYQREKKDPIGTVIERRSKERGDNILGLLRLARKMYAKNLEDALHIAIDWNEAQAP